MTYKSVFRSLQEVFPQVDLRILKAVAMEHSKDVDAAVEFILLEVLPSISGSSEESYPHPGMQEEHPSTEVGMNKQVVSLGDLGVEEANTSLLSEPKPVECVTALSDDDRTSLGYVKSSCMGESTEGSHAEFPINPLEADSLIPCNEVVKELNANLGSEAQSSEYKMNFISDHKNDTSDSKSYMEETEASGSLSYGGNSHDQLIVGPEQVQFLEQVDQLFQTGALHTNAQEFSGSEVNETVSAMHTNAPDSSLVLEIPDLMEYGAQVEKDSSSSVRECEQKLSQCSNFSEANGTVLASFTSDQDISSLTLDNFINFTNIAAEAQKDLCKLPTEHELMLSACYAETISNLVSSDSALVSALDSDIPSTMTTRSGHVVSINLLEDFIADAKSNKKTLTSAVETVSDMLKEVEIFEERAKQAKEEAFTADQEIITKVEELKQMLKHAKEANDMHAGEIYGEKSILAAEARELQSRLLNLSDERNKSLSITDEIRGTLEVRLLAAKKEIVAAEQQKDEKEELASKALQEQQELMDTIVEESKKLQQEAEENSKMREFLMDRGRVVDMLQGEIAVVCEDVLSLKDRVDGRVPLSRSRSLMSSSFASSSSSSLHRSTASSDRVLNPVESAESPRMIYPEYLRLQVESMGSSGKEVAAYDKPVASDDKPVASDDEWELFETET